MFELHIWNVVLRRQLGIDLPIMRIEQMDCTMARCNAVGLPGDLERAAEIVKAPVQKSKIGAANMMKMAKPQRVFFYTDEAARAYQAGARLQLIEDTETSTMCVVEGSFVDYIRFDWYFNDAAKGEQISYCIDDVGAETGIDDVVPYLIPKMRKLWELNEKINRRGIPIDVALAKKMEGIVHLSAKRADRRMWTLTGGVAKKASHHQNVKKWLDDQGVRAYVLKDGEERTSVGKGVTDELLANAGYNQAAKEVIELHNGSSKSSTSKLTRAFEVMSSDNRIRGVFGFHLAATGRFAARNWQAHNLVRIDEDVELPTVRAFIKICEQFSVDASADTIELASGRTLHWLSKMSRPIIRATPGKIFNGADLSNIEGRLNAWLAGEDWKVQAFRDFDNKIGPDLYKVTAASLLAVSTDAITKAQRQNYGKVPDLAGGYQGSVGAYVSMGLQLGVKPEEIADIAAANTDPEVWSKVASGYRPRYSNGLEQSVWTGIKVVVNAWRARHPKIVQSWRDRQDAAIMAVSNPGQIVECCSGRIRYMASHGFLWCMLPSGRPIAYPLPALVNVPQIRERTVWVNGVEVIEEYEEFKTAVQVWGIEKGQWVPYTLFGGIQTENDVQGLAMDVCFDGITDLDVMGYYVIFHCHDEVLSEDDPNFGSPQEVKAVLSRPRDYVPALPLAAAAWQDERYVK